MIFEKLIYLATPYSHDDPEVVRERFEVVNLAAAVLFNQGSMVFSPISHTHPIAMAGGLVGDWEFWQKYDELMLSKCDVMYVLGVEGWQESKGVRAERLIAYRHNIPTFLLLHDENGALTLHYLASPESTQ